MRHLLLILILCVYQLGIAQTDSLVTGQKMDQSFDHAYQFKYKKLIVPSVFIGYGILSLTSDDLKQLNRSTQYEIGEHQPEIK